MNDRPDEVRRTPWISNLKDLNQIHYQAIKSTKCQKRHLKHYPFEALGLKLAF